MLKDVLRTLAQSRLPQRVVVFTASPEVVRLAEAHGFDVVHEELVDGHSAAVNRMVEELSISSSRIMSIASDLPRLQPSEVDFAFNVAAEPITLIPSRDWTGTNGVV